MTAESLVKELIEKRRKGLDDPYYGELNASEIKEFLQILSAIQEDNATKIDRAELKKWLHQQARDHVEKQINTLGVIDSFRIYHQGAKHAFDAVVKHIQEK